MTDRQALLSAAGKQRPYKAVNINPPAMPGDIYLSRNGVCLETAKVHDETAYFHDAAGF